MVEGVEELGTKLKTAPIVGPAKSQQFSNGKIHVRLPGSIDDMTKHNCSQQPPLVTLAELRESAVPVASDSCAAGRTIHNNALPVNDGF